MGYVPKRTVYTLDFEGTEQDGMVVKMRAAKLGVVFGSADMIGIQQRVSDNVMPTQEEAHLALSQYTDLADHLVSWNLDAEDGTPLPATLDGLKTLEVPLIRLISETWQSAMSGVALPLSGGSSSGPLPDVDLAMAPIPASLLSSSTPS